MKKLLKVHRSLDNHWVGDGFPVRTMLSYNKDTEQTSPFLLLDYAGPYDFAPSKTPRGVQMHPHRGFETVTIVYQGALRHKDTSGNEGQIGPGDVQWMTAGSGLLHEELHDHAFTREGGTMEMVQLWVNLPAKDKMASPHYQTLLKSEIPEVLIDAPGSRVRVIAGTFQGTRGPAKTFTPVDLWDVRLSAGQKLQLSVTEGFNTLIFLRKGTLRINDQEVVNDAEIALFAREGKEIAITAEKESAFLVLQGQPIEEPVVGHGPFVMNTEEEIGQAIADYRAGRFSKNPG